MIGLDERLRDLADSVALPATTPDQDLERGRARRRRRDLGTLGAALTTAAVIGTTVTLLANGSGHPGAGPGFAGGPATPDSATADVAPQVTAPESVTQVTRRHLQGSGTVLGDLSPAEQRRVDRVLAGYRDILRDDLDPDGTRLGTSPISNRQVGDDSLGTKLDWNDGGMLQIAVGRSLEGVQFFCDDACTRRTVAGATEAFVLTSPGAISVAVVQDDGDVVALTADTSFGNNGTSTDHLGVTVDELLAAATDARIDLPADVSPSPGSGQH